MAVLFLGMGKLGRVEIFVCLFDGENRIQLPFSFETTGGNVQAGMWVCSSERAQEAEGNLGVLMVVKAAGLAEMHHLRRECAQGQCEGRDLGASTPRMKGKRRKSQQRTQKEQTVPHKKNQQSEAFGSFLQKACQLGVGPFQAKCPISYSISPARLLSVLQKEGSARAWSPCFSFWQMECVISWWWSSFCSMLSLLSICWARP